MRLKNKTLLAAAFGLVLVAQPALAGIHLNPFHHKTKAAPADATTPAPVDAPTTPGLAPAQSAPDTTTQSDDVGYAELGITGGVSLAHATLPQASFVEITNLDTGKTILAVVSAQIAPGHTLALLSPQAMSALGGTNGQRLPVRIRRVNPPQQEQAALLAGQPVSDRLDTPPVLLNALKRKLAGVQGQSATAPHDGGAMAEATPAAVVPQPSSTQKSLTRPQPRTPPKSVAHATPAPQSSAPASDTSRFIVEDAGHPHHDIVTTTTPHKAALKASSSGTRAETAPSRPAAQPIAQPAAAFYIQIAALSSESSAKAMVAKLGKGASVQPAGHYWRVRMGPYANEEKAKAALGPIAAKGYRDARLTH